MIRLDDWMVSFVVVVVVVVVVVEFFDYFYLLTDPAKRVPRG